MIKNMSNIGDRIILKAKRRIVEDRSDVGLRELSLLESSNLNLIRKKSFGKLDMLAVLTVMKNEFSFPQDAEARLWTSSVPDPSSLRPVHDNFVRTLDEVGIYHGHFVIIEVKNEDGTWPTDVGYHRQRKSEKVSQGCENQEYSSTERFKIFHGEIEELKVKADTKKKELDLLNQELKTISDTHKRGKKRLRDQETELEKIKKQQDTLSERRKVIEKDMHGVLTTNKSLIHKIDDKEGKHRKLNEELKELEDDLQEYAKTTKNILEKIEPEPKMKKEQESFIEFMAKSIKEKEEALTCPVCLETASAPIFMCQKVILASRDLNNGL